MTAELDEHEDPAEAFKTLQQQVFAALDIQSKSPALKGIELEKIQF